jgi:DNA invertase Pin-like site-specific DNA recombinase
MVTKPSRGFERTHGLPGALGVRAPRVAVYVRVSTEEQAEGHSLEYQEEACRRRADELGPEHVALYRDAGFSAKSANRPAFQRMLEDVDACKVDVVIVLKLDRFARNRLDGLLAKQRMEKAGVKLISVTEPLDDTPAGLITEGMLQLIAEWYSVDLKHKVTAGLRKRAEKGLMNAMPPFGYAQSDDPRAEPPTIVSDEAAAVLLAFERYATGCVTYKQIAAEFNAAGFRTRHRAPKGDPQDGARQWTGDSIRALIQCPVYKGVVTHKGEEFQGRHEAIVSEELWSRANEVGTRLRGRATTWKPVRFYPLAGILRCAGCGSPLQGNNMGKHIPWRYYRETAARRGIPCDKPQISVRADEIEPAVDDIVARFRMPANVRRKVIELLGAEDDAAASEAAEAKIRERLRRLSRLYGEMELSEAEYGAQRRKLEAELERLTIPRTKAAAAVEHFDLLQAAWKKATPEEKRGLGLALFEAIYFDLATMTIAEVVVQPAFRPWLAPAEPHRPEAAQDG